MPIGYVRTLADVYRFEPVPPGLSPGAAAHVLGAQANVWTEVMEDQSRVDYQVFPRLAAFAEVVWSRLPSRRRGTCRASKRGWPGTTRGWTHSASTTGRPAARCPGSGARACWGGRSRGSPRTCDSGNRSAAGCRTGRFAVIRNRSGLFGNLKGFVGIISGFGRNQAEAGDLTTQGGSGGRAGGAGATLAPGDPEDVPELPRPGGEHVPYGGQA